MDLNRDAMLVGLHIAAWSGRLEDIAGGLDDLAGILRRRAILSIAIPPLGCGLGGLSWPAVRSLLVDRLAPCEGVSIVIHEPARR